MKKISMLCDIFHQTSKRMPKFFMYIWFFINQHLFTLTLFDFYYLVKYWHFFPCYKRLFLTVGMGLFALVSVFFISVEIITRDSRMKKDEDEYDIEDWYDPWNL